MFRFIGPVAVMLIPSLGFLGSAVARDGMPVSIQSHSTVHVAAMPLLGIATLLRQVARSDVTKPAGAALDARPGTKPNLDTRSHRLHHLIRTSVCNGC